MNNHMDAWRGKFYLHDDDRLDYFEAPNSRTDQFGPLYHFRSVLPWDVDIEETSKRYPSHATTLKTWSEIWEGSFPNWREEHAKCPSFVKEKTGPISKATVETDGVEAELDEIIVDIIEEKGAWRWREANMLMSHFQAKLTTQTEPQVDPFLRVIKSAQGVLAFRHLLPYVSAVNAGGDNCLLVGFDNKGNPIFEKTKRTIHLSDAERAWNDVHNCAFEIPEIWRIPALDKYREGHVIGTYGGSKALISASDAADSLTLLSAIIADMSLQGITEVVIEETFLRMYTPAPKRWILNIHGCRDPLVAKRLLQDAMPEQEDWLVTVAPTFSAEYRQRMFVLDGEVVGSVATDPKAAPEINGERFAKTATNLTTGANDVREDVSSALKKAGEEIAGLLSEHGVREYALDLEIGNSKVMIGGIYPLTVTDTYSHDINHLMASIGVQQQRLVSKTKESVAGIDKDLLEYAELMSIMIDKIGAAQLTMMIVVTEYGRRHYTSDSLEKALEKCLRDLLWHAHRSVQGGLFKQNELDSLNITRWQNSVVTDWLRSKQNDNEMIKIAIQWIAEKKGIALSPLD